MFVLNKIYRYFNGVMIVCARHPASDVFVCSLINYFCLSVSLLIWHGRDNEVKSCMIRAITTLRGNEGLRSQMKQGTLQLRKDIKLKRNKEKCFRVLIERIRTTSHSQQK